MEFTKELRIGAYVFDESIGYLQVRTGKDIDNIYKGKWDVTPIKIDWCTLRDFKFKDSLGDNYWIYSNFSDYALKLIRDQHLRNGHGCSFYKIMQDDSYLDMNLDCFFIHDLQNLFLALLKLKI